MKNKRIYLFGLIIVFFFVIIALLFITFTIKEVEITFSCSEKEEQSLDIKKDLEELKGTNLVFFKKQKVQDILSEYPYFEMQSFSKNFPSKLEISVKERHKTYSYYTGEFYYILSDEGIVLEKNIEYTSGLIDLDLSIKEGYQKIEVFQTEIGDKIKTSNDEILQSVFEITSSVNLTDSIDKVHLFYSSILKFYHIEYLTHTNVVIYISEANDSGLEKAKLVFKEYDNEESDYKKSSDSDMYYVFKDKDGNLKITFGPK